MILLREEMATRVVSMYRACVEIWCFESPKITLEISEVIML